MRAVYQAYLACRRHKRGARETQRYELALLDHLIETREALVARRWSPARSITFVTLRPKAREIHAAPFADRVVQHLLVSRLETLYEPRFIHDSYANRRGKGTHAAVDRLQQFQRQATCNGQRRAWFLQLDIAIRLELWNFPSLRSEPPRPLTGPPLVCLKSAKV